MKDIESKFAWSFFGVLLTVIITVFTLSYEKKPEIVFDIINETNVLDVRQPVKDLVVLFQNENIEEKKENLRILQVKISNQGQADVLQSHYDADDIFGLEVENAKLIEVRLVDSNSSYLKGKLSPKIQAANIVQFNKLIFEKNKYVVVELLVLHTKDGELNITPLGKIVNMDKIPLTNSWLKSDKGGFFQQLLYGNFQVHAVRFLLDVLLLFLIIAVLVFVSSKLDEIKSRKKEKIRQAEISALFTDLEIKNSKFLSDISSFYIRNPYCLDGIKKMVNDEAQRGLIYKKMVNSGIDNKEAKYEIDLSDEETRLLFETASYYSDIELCKKLISLGALANKGSSLSVDTAFKDEFNSFFKKVEKLKADKKSLKIKK